MVYICSICRYIHDPLFSGSWFDLPDNYTCPDCGAQKQDFDLFDGL